MYACMYVCMYGQGSRQEAHLVTKSSSPGGHDNRHPLHPQHAQQVDVDGL